jgi:hypothetical protein
MTDLLDLAVAAHGGLERWRAVTTIDLDLSITGAIWEVKGRPKVLQDISMTVRTDEEVVLTTYHDKDLRTTFRPHLITIESPDGAVLERSEDPEKAFVGQQLNDPWSDVHVTYFSGEALWTYLNVPFVDLRDDFVTEEIDPIEVAGEPWRRLRVLFPDSVKSHTREQISCFGPDGLLRRHDYTVDILGGGTGLNYATEYREVGGIVFPTHRRIYAYTGDYELVPEPLLVSIDLGEIRLS